MFLSLLQSCYLLLTISLMRRQSTLKHVGKWDETLKLHYDYSKLMTRANLEIFCPFSEMPENRLNATCYVMKIMRTLSACDVTNSFCNHYLFTTIRWKDKALKFSKISNHAKKQLVGIKTNIFPPILCKSMLSSLWEKKYWEQELLRLSMEGFK